jgi:hypothetical protein
VKFIFKNTLCDRSSEVLCSSVLVKCFVQVFQISSLCECSREIHCASVLTRCFVQVF